MQNAFSKYVKPAAPKRKAKADQTPRVELSAEQLTKAEQVAEAIASRKSAEVFYSSAKAELENTLETIRVELSQQQGRFIPTIAINLSNKRVLKYTKKQQGTGPKGTQQAEQVAAIEQQLGPTEAARYLRTETIFQVQKAALENAELMAKVVERLGPELVSQLFESVESVALTPEFWTQQTLDNAFRDRAAQLEKAGIVKARPGEFSCK